MSKEQSDAWIEYDNAAEDMARRGRKGQVGELLPANMTPEAVQLIADDPEAFERRVRDNAYALAMEKQHQADEQALHEAILFRRWRVADAARVSH